MNYKKLINKIWVRGENNLSPRFCLPDYQEVSYRGKIITHYDFYWAEKGKEAHLLLYTASSYGAVMDEEITKVCSLRYKWDTIKKEFVK